MAGLEPATFPLEVEEPRPAQQAEPISEEIASELGPVERVELSDS
jgi:hypothetical protein